jgi:hypothetical protein
MFASTSEMAEAQATEQSAKPRPVTERIARIIETVPGWTPPDELLALHLLAVATAPMGGDILEIGSWCGRSTAVLGHAVAETGGHVWAVDLFPRGEDWRSNADGSHSFSVDLEVGKVGGYEDQTVWDEPFQRDIATVYEKYEGALDAFEDTIHREQLGAVVTPFRGTGKMFVNHAPGVRTRLAFLDGDHSYDAVVADIDAAEQVLIRGGWIAFDDAFSVYDGVDAAIRDRVLASGKYEGAHQVCRKFFVARRK